MQTARMSVQRARPRQRSCTECRRRRQKCSPRIDGPCSHCARRYPPVECIMPEQVEKPIRKPKVEAEIDMQQSQCLSSKFTDPPVKRPHVSPYPELSDDKQSKQTKSDLHSSLGSSSVSTSSSVIDTEGYVQLSTLERDENSENISPESELGMILSGRGFTRGPKAFGGVLTAISSLYSPAIKPTIRNAELFYIFHHFVIPNFVSIDGSAVPKLFTEHMLPWMIQSPLMPNIAILMASYSQARERGFEVQKYSETLSIKVHVLSLINEFLKQDFDLIGFEALRAVIHLVILEWFWGADANLWAHMKGLKQMIKLRGGFRGMGDPLLVQVLILTDYELACCFERDVYLQPTPSGAEDLQIPASYPERFKSPLLPYPENFLQVQESLNLGLASAEILDDVRLLTLAITNSSATSRSKIQNIATWLNKKVVAMSVDPVDPTITPGRKFIYRTIRLAALIYSTCIMSLIPFRDPCHEPLLQELYENLSRVSMKRWGEIPGITLWILLIAAPSRGNDAQGRFLKKKMAVAGMSVGMENFNLATGQLRAFWKLQRWIAKERQRAIDLKVEV